MKALLISWDRPVRMLIPFTYEWKRVHAAAVVPENNGAYRVAVIGYNMLPKISVYRTSRYVDTFIARAVAAGAYLNGRRFLFSPVPVLTLGNVVFGKGWISDGTFTIKGRRAELLSFAVRYFEGSYRAASRMSNIITNLTTEVDGTDLRKLVEKGLENLTPNEIAKVMAVVGSLDKLIEAENGTLKVFGIPTKSVFAKLLKDTENICSIYWNPKSIKKKVEEKILTELGLKAIGDSVLHGIFIWGYAEPLKYLVIEGEPLKEHLSLTLQFRYHTLTNAWPYIIINVPGDAPVARVLKKVLNCEFGNEAIKCPLKEIIEKRQAIKETLSKENLTKEGLISREGGFVVADVSAALLMVGNALFEGDYDLIHLQDAFMSAVGRVRKGAANIEISGIQVTNDNIRVDNIIIIKDYDEGVVHVISNKRAISIYPDAKSPTVNVWSYKLRGLGITVGTLSSILTYVLKKLSITDIVGEDSVQLGSIRLVNVNKELVRAIELIKSTILQKLRNIKHKYFYNPRVREDLDTFVDVGLTLVSHDYNFDVDEEGNIYINGIPLKYFKHCWSYGWDACRLTKYLERFVATTDFKTKTDDKVYLVYFGGYSGDPISLHNYIHKRFYELRMENVKYDELKLFYELLGKYAWTLKKEYKVPIYGISCEGVIISPVESLATIAIQLGACKPYKPSRLICKSPDLLDVIMNLENYSEDSKYYTRRVAVTMYETGLGRVVDVVAREVPKKIVFGDGFWDDNPEYAVLERHNNPDKDTRDRLLYKFRDFYREVYGVMREYWDLALYYAETGIYSQHHIETTPRKITT